MMYDPLGIVFPISSAASARSTIVLIAPPSTAKSYSPLASLSLRVPPNSGNLFCSPYERKGATTKAAPILKLRLEPGNRAERRTASHDERDTNVSANRLLAKLEV